MPFSPVSKQPGNTIYSADWNAAMDEIKRLETDKLNSSGGEISGALTVGNAVTSGTEAALVVRHNGSFAWGNALSINQVAQGNSDGPKIRFQRTVGAAQSWSMGILNGQNARQFAILEDTSAGYGNSRLVIAPGGNVGVGINDPKAKLHVSGGSWDLTSSEGDLAIGTAAHRLKIGVATGGAGAGDVRVRAHGGTNQLILGSGNNDTLYIRGDGLSVTSNSIMSFDLKLRQMLNLWNNTYGIGIQNKAMYFRSEFNFAWYKGGAHNDATGNAGAGGTVLMRVDSDGTVRAKTVAPLGGDYAEFFESESGAALPVGVSVVIVKDGKVRPAKKGEIPIGIISSFPGVLGNSPIEWAKKYMKDDYGNNIMEIVEDEVPKSEAAAVEWQGILDRGGNLTKKDRKRLLHTIKVKRPVINPEYNPEQTFIPREERPEWQKVGLLGQLHLTKGQPVAPSWVKMKDISDSVELWLIK